jgi:predicted glycosyltransferase
MDFEHTPANHLAFRLARTVVVPEAIPGSSIRKFGAHGRKVQTYPGFKEQVYLGGFQSTPDALAPELTDADCVSRVLVVARPPADFAVYHRFSNPLFEEWLRLIGRRSDVLLVVLPRTATQAEQLVRLGFPSLRIPKQALHGPELLIRADLVVSAGGTMNREAAVLGIPAYSFFGGESPAVDQALARLGRLQLVRTRADLASIPIQKSPRAVPMQGSDLRRYIVDLILEQGRKASKSLEFGRA